MLPTQELPRYKLRLTTMKRWTPVQKYRQHQRAVVIDIHKVRLTCTGRRRLKAANTLSDREKNSHQAAVTMVQSTSFNLLKKVIMPVFSRAFLMVEHFSFYKVLLWSYTVDCLANNICK